MPKENRKQIILQSLASLLEERNLSKVTTALLAEKSSITEAALYRPVSYTHLTLPTIYSV